MTRQATQTAQRPLAWPAEVAEYLGVPEETLSQWRSRGKGPKWGKVGKHVRYKWAEVERWFDEQVQDAGGAR